MKIQSIKTEAILTDDVLQHLTYLQSDANTAIEDRVQCCEKIGNLLLEVAMGGVLSVDHEELLYLLYMNNSVRQMFNDMRVPEKG